MKTVASIVVLLGLSLSAHAQRGFSGRPSSGWPSAVHPRPPASGVCCRGPGHVPLGSQRFGGSVAVPYVVPVPIYTGGQDYVDPPQPEAVLPPDPPSPPPPPIPMTMPPQRPIPPPPIPEKTCDSANGARQDQADSVHLFIALKSSLVYPAVAYWVQRGTLHYITPGGSHNLVSLPLVDRKLSDRLNAGGIVEFTLPPE